MYNLARTHRPPRCAPRRMRRAERHADCVRKSTTFKKRRKHSECTLDVRSVQRFALQKSNEAIPVKACLVPPQMVATARLRFAVGDDVECFIDAWHRACVVALNQYDEVRAAHRIATVLFALCLCRLPKKPSLSHSHRCVCCLNTMRMAGWRRSAVPGQVDGVTVRGRARLGAI